jgi:hypothetical protein
MNAEPPIPFPQAARIAETISFDRQELAVILSLYGRMVAAGEWRDYAITAAADVAIFSIFRRTGEHPLYRVEKRPRLRQRQGLYAVIGSDGQVLRRGHELGAALRVLEPRPVRAVD